MRYFPKACLSAKGARKRDGMMRKITAILLISLFIITNSTVAKGYDDGYIPMAVSDAISLGFAGESLTESFRDKITRAEFALMAVNFAAMENNLDVLDFYVIHSVKYSDRDFPTNFLSDSTDNGLYEAYRTGVITGRNKGSLDPNTFITRQEAAVMLINTYVAYSGDQPSAPPSNKKLRDADQTADWAVKDAHLVWTWDVMPATSENDFKPLGSCTKEECAQFLMNLYHNAPVTSYKSNLKRILSYDEAMERLTVVGNKSYEWMSDIETFDCANYTVLYGYQDGGPHASPSYLWIVYKDGGRREILSRILDPMNPMSRYGFYAYQFALSKDEKTLYFIAGYADVYAVDLPSASIINPK